MKIENKVKEMPAVSEATVDFVSKKLRVEVANKKRTRSDCSKYNKCRSKVRTRCESCS